MKIISWNVNGLRAVLKKGFLDFVAAYQPDILGIQETKLKLVQVPPEIFEIPGYHKYWSCADRAGYSGTALFTRTCPDMVSYSIGDQAFDGEGRIVQADYPDFTLFNIYFPNGQMNDERLDYKLRFYDQFLVYAQKLRNAGKNIIVMGDFNTAHKPIDLAHPKANEKYSGFLPIERAWLDSFVEQGYVDTLRHFDGSADKYTWWSYMRHARENNVGWRIDYCFVNKEFIDKVTSAFILPNVLGSDHCPVGIELSL